MEIVLDKGFKELIEKYTRKEFDKLYKVGASTLKYRDSYRDAVGCPLLRVDAPTRCANNDKSCRECWKEQIEKANFKKEEGDIKEDMNEEQEEMKIQGMETFTPEFEEIMSSFTRKEFENEFDVEGVLYLKSNHDMVLSCPFADEECPKGVDCRGCWEAGVKLAKFKDEDGEPKILIRSPEAISKARIICKPRGLQDPYLNEDRVHDRLVKEFNEHGELIIAYDFDNTISDPRNEGHTYNRIIDLLRRWRGKAKFICFTCRTTDRYVGVMEYLIKNDIPVDRINCGFEGVPNGEHKPYYNAFLDDRSGLCETYNVLNKVLNTISK